MGDITRNLEFYNLAHFSLVPQGSWRLATTASRGLLASAFLLPNRSRVVVVAANPNRRDASLSVAVNGQGFEFTLPKGAATFAWDPTAPVPPTPPPTPPTPVPPTPPPTPPTPVPPTPPGSITSRLSGKCLDLPNGDASNGVRLWVQDCDAAHDSQRWVFAGGHLKYAGAAASEMCVDVIDGHMVMGQRLQVWNCNGKPQQDWGYNADIGHISVAGQESLCLDLEDGGQSSGTPVQVWACYDGNKNQQWDLTVAPNLTDFVVQLVI